MTRFLPRQIRETPRGRRDRRVDDVEGRRAFPRIPTTERPRSDALRTRNESEELPSVKRRDGRGGTAERAGRAREARAADESGRSATALRFPSRRARGPRPRRTRERGSRGRGCRNVSGARARAPFWADQTTASAMRSPTTAPALSNARCKPNARPRVTGRDALREERVPGSASHSLSEAIERADAEDRAPRSSRRGGAASRAAEIP